MASREDGLGSQLTRAEKKGPGMYNLSFVQLHHLAYQLLTSETAFHVGIYHNRTRLVLFPCYFWLRKSPCSLDTLSSLRYTQDPITPPMMLTMVLPMLPPQLSSIILNGLRYLQMFGILLDDLAAVLVAVGFVVFISGWIAT